MWNCISIEYAKKTWWVFLDPVGRSIVGPPKKTLTSPKVLALTERTLAAIRARQGEVLGKTLAWNVPLHENQPSSPFWS